MRSLIAALAGHRVAPNLLMLLMIISGLFVLGRLEIRFFPEFNTNTIEISIPWAGNAASNVNDSLLTPLENELRNVPDLKEMTSYASDGLGLVYLEFPDRIDLDAAMDDVRRYLDLAKGSLPADSEEAEARVILYDDEVMRLSLTGHSVKDLRKIARKIENELLALGDVSIDVNGLYEEVIEIRLNQQRLVELGLTPLEVGRQIAAQNLDVTAGDINSSASTSKLVRSLSQKESISDIGGLVIIDQSGNITHLREVATLQRVPKEDVAMFYFNGRPAVQFNVNRQADGNAIQAGKKVNEWLQNRRDTLPAGFELTAHKEEWRQIQSRLNLLVENGAQGLAIVILFLFLFLNWRLAVWIGVGIPCVFLVSLGVLFFLGGSIDMLTMFAFIMVTGIVVDDSIVVGENALYHLQQGKSPMTAAVEGAKEMFAAVFSSTFTTISSFLPLMIIGGPIGAILFVIPLVVICVLLSALFECFAVLPGHLARSFQKIRVAKDGSAAGPQHIFDKGFNRFQEGPFRALVKLVLRYRLVAIVSAVVMLVLSISLFISGQVKFIFFPGAELNRIQVQARFIAGTPREVMVDYMGQLEQSMFEVINSYDEEILEYYSTNLGVGLPLFSPVLDGFGDEIGSMYVELTGGEHRQTKILDVVAQWNEQAPPSAYLDNLIIRAEEGGPPGEDLQIRLSGQPVSVLKESAKTLQTQLNDIPGVARPKDDTPLGKKQLTFNLTAQGHALNLSVDDIATQIRYAFDGFRVQTFYEGSDEIEVRALLDHSDIVGDLESFRITLPNRQTALLGDVVAFSSTQGFDKIRKINGASVIDVTGDVDFAVTDVGTVIRQLESDVLPAIVNIYGIEYSFVGAQEEERATVSDMKTGLALAGLLIFIILTAVFSSWTLPIIIILTAPLGIIGAILGHWVMGAEMSILSLFGMFTLMGIVINDSIILVREYLNRQANGEASNAQADIVEAVCRRFRAIILTSVTTIGGLVPLMFETSTQAQFLIPMAISICFGLAFATLLILFVMPSLLSYHVSISHFFGRMFNR